MAILKLSSFFNSRNQDIHSNSVTDQIQNLKSKYLSHFFSGFEYTQNYKAISECPIIVWICNNFNNYGYEKAFMIRNIT